MGFSELWPRKLAGVDSHVSIAVKSTCADPTRHRGVDPRFDVSWTCLGVLTSTFFILLVINVLTPSQSVLLRLVRPEMSSKATSRTQVEEALLAGGRAEAEEDASWDELQAIVHIQSPHLPSSLHLICHSSALATVQGAAVGVWWDVQRKTLKTNKGTTKRQKQAAAADVLVPLSHLVSLPPNSPLRVLSHLPRGFTSLEGGKAISRGANGRNETFEMTTVTSSACPPSDSQVVNRSNSTSSSNSPMYLPPIQLFISKRSQINKTVDGCLLSAEITSCLQSLQPVPAVTRLLEEEDIGRIRNSTAVLLENPRSRSLPPSSVLPLSSCPNASSLPTCLIRNLTMRFLADPNKEFTVASPSDPLWTWQVVSAFDSDRAPLMLNATVKRVWECHKGERRPDDAAGADGVAADGAAAAAASSVSDKSEDLSMASVCAQYELSELLLLSLSPRLIFTHHSAALALLAAWGANRNKQQQQQQPGYRIVFPSLCSACPPHLFTNKWTAHMIVDERLSALYCALPKVGNTSWKLWLQMQRFNGNATEAFEFKASTRNTSQAPSPAPAAADPAPAPADASASAAAAAAAAAPTSVTLSSSLPPATFSFPSGTADTFEALQKPSGTADATHSTNTTDTTDTTNTPTPTAVTTASLPPDVFTHIHVSTDNSITELFELSEEEAIRLVTRRRMFRFTVVRNPFTRVTSAYLDKFVHARNFTNTGDARYYWAYVMFSNTPLYPILRDLHPACNFTFLEFLELTEQALRMTDWVENHIDTQVSLCGLDSIHYDYVGQFERMDESVEVVMRRLNTSDYGMFKKGKAMQLTSADLKAASLYNKPMFDKVRQIYAADFDIPYNNIHYNAPKSLKQYEYNQ